MHPTAAASHFKVPITSLVAVFDPKALTFCAVRTLPTWLFWGKWYHRELAPWSLWIKKLYGNVRLQVGFSDLSQEDLNMLSQVKVDVHWEEGSCLLMRRHEVAMEGGSLKSTCDAFLRPKILLKDGWEEKLIDNTARAEMLLGPYSKVSTSQTYSKQKILYDPEAS